MSFGKYLITKMFGDAVIIWGEIKINHAITMVNKNILIWHILWSRNCDY